MQAAKEELFKASRTHQTPTEEKTNENSTPILCDGLLGGSEWDIGFVFAMPMEAAGVVDRLKEAKKTQGNGRTFYTGLFCNYRVVVVESGVGQTKAKEATEVLFDVFQPKRILSAGYAGGLSERLKRFNVCLPEIVIRESDGKKISLSQPVPEIIQETVSEKLILLTTDFVVHSEKQKQVLGKKNNAELVDMETFAVAEVCRNRRIPFLAVRIILDTVQEQLPQDIQRILKNTEKGRARLVGSVLGSLFSRP
jgi:adenosylhomocysteine nucleosidase